MSGYREPSPLRLVPMCAVLSFLLLCAAEATGWFALLFFLPIALCMLPLCAERLWGYLLLCDLLIAACVLALPVPHYAWLAFAAVLAPFVPVRHALRNLRKPYLQTLLAVGITILWTVLVLFGLTFLGVNLLIVYSVPVTLLAVLCVLLFLFLLDAAYQLCLKWYQNRLRRFLLPRA
ncbi:MAG: hypothetical protein II117_07085 [Clostridia bacterium]|nr:hypothetical protein [Clostridia bacterium]